MKAVIQRCTAAHVEVDGEVVGRIGPGLVIFLGVGPEDDEAVAAKMARKVAGLRIFDNEEGKFDRSLQDVKGAALVISNFTLYGDARKGTRPNFGGAARPEKAQALYERFVTLLQEQDVDVQTGTFAAAMKVCVENDGPVTLVLDL
jgi:D-tyrosyl-tRNA(Tyr) deacylase